MAVVDNKSVGIKGENLAVKYLKKNGYKILERNWRTKFGEVDIIALKEDVIVFVEVKTSLTDIFGTPSDRVNYYKQRRYKLCANYYFAEREVNYTVRFDIIEVYRKSVNHIIDAFQP